MCYSIIWHVLFIVAVKSTRLSNCCCRHVHIVSTTLSPSPKSNGMSMFGKRSCIVDSIHTKTCISRFQISSMSQLLVLLILKFHRQLLCDIFFTEIDAAQKRSQLLLVIIFCILWFLVLMTFIMASRRWWPSPLVWIGMIQNTIRHFGQVSLILPNER